LHIGVLVPAGSLMAQTPQSFKYQAVARDASGDVVADQAVGMQISILKGSITGTAVYVETFTPTRVWINEPEYWSRHSCKR